MTDEQEPTAPFEFDFDSLSEPQITALGNVAFGMDFWMNKRTLGSLVAKGLIEPVERTTRDRFGEMRWTTYVMPIYVHIAFCEWCSKQEAGNAI